LNKVIFILISAINIFKETQPKQIKNISNMPNVDKSLDLITQKQAVIKLHINRQPPTMTYK